MPNFNESGPYVALMALLTTLTMLEKSRSGGDLITMTRSAMLPVAADGNVVSFLGSGMSGAEVSAIEEARAFFAFADQALAAR